MGETYTDAIYSICVTEHWKKGNTYSHADIYNRRKFFLDNLTHDTDLKSRWDEEHLGILCSVLNITTGKRFTAKDFFPARTLRDHVDIITDKDKVIRPPQFGHHDPSIDIYLSEGSYLD